MIHKSGWRAFGSVENGGEICANFPQGVIFGKREVGVNINVQMRVENLVDRFIRVAFGPSNEILFG